MTFYIELTDEIFHIHTLYPDTRDLCREYLIPEVIPEKVSEEIKTKDDALTALIHLGYLGYDVRSKKAFIPNFEVSMAYNAALITGNW